MKRPNWDTIKGKTINYLTIIEEGRIENNKQKILVRCVCWVEKKVQLNNINSGSTKSCGCKKSETISISKKTHGMWGSNGIYNIFRSIKSRCNNKNNKDFKHYGGRGIKVVRTSFEEFYEDMGSTYKEGLSIDRIDNNGNYCKSNCRWATSIEQGNNRRNNRIIVYNNKKYTLSQLSKLLEVNRCTLAKRLNKYGDVALDNRKNIPTGIRTGYVLDS